MRLYNTSSRQIEELKPLSGNTFTFYACGPTVYDFTHIGHLRTQVNNDLLRRALTYLGSKVKQAMNITDVGHLTGDTDEGGDKMEKGADKSGMTVLEVAKKYTEQFLDSTKAVNVLPPDGLLKATDHIEEMILLIKKLEEKGFVYPTDEAIYFSTEKFKPYGRLSGQKLTDKIAGAREEVHTDPNKKNSADFAVWFFTVGRFKDHVMHWPFKSTEGLALSERKRVEGFPGWHIECSAMSMKYLGETIDIHAGGVDLIPVHHENEIAQSEAATGRPFVRHWFHSEFLLVDGEKMSKSKANFYTIQDVIHKGFDPIALRYLFLQTHYRKQLNFTWDGLESAQNAMAKLKEAVLSLKTAPERPPISEEKLSTVRDLSQQFADNLASDLSLPQALSTLWQTVKSNIPSSDKLELLLEFDRVLGLGLDQVEATDTSLPSTIKKLKTDYEVARRAKNFSLSDRLRRQASDLGYSFENSIAGTNIKKNSS